MAVRRDLKYPNLTILFAVLFLTYIFLRTGFLDEMVGILGRFGYFSAFLLGIFFVSTFTVAPATALLFLLSESLNIFGISVLAGLGAVIGDYTILRFVQNGIIRELRYVFDKVSGENLIRFHWIIHTEYFAWLGPVLGAILIASPFPDELGIGLLGIYKLNHKQFALLSFILNTFGIFVLLSGIRVILFY